MEYGTTLSHHGILNQKWGVRNGPPYPLSPGAHSAAEKRSAKSGISTLAQYVSNRKKKYKRKKAVEKARQTRIQNEKKKYEKEHYDELKAKALKAGTATDVMKYKGDLTNQQLRDVIDRLGYESKLMTMSEAERATLGKKIDRAMSKLDTGRDWLEKGSRAYNAVAKVINAFDGEDSLPIIGEKHKDKNQTKTDKFKRKQEKEKYRALKLNNDEKERKLNKEIKAEKTKKKEEQAAKEQEKIKKLAEIIYEEEKKKNS